LYRAAASNCCPTPSLWSRPAAAQQPAAGKVYRISVLSLDLLSPGLLDAVRDGLRELGYIEGRNLTLEARQADGQIDRLDALAADLAHREVDLILTVNSPAALAAKKATATIPIVMTRTIDPARAGLVPSFSRPGGNITGITSMPEELGAKQLQLLKEALPAIARVAVLWSETIRAAATVTVGEMERVGAQLGVELLSLPVRSSDDLPGAFETAARGRAEALVVIDDIVITRHRDAIVALATQRGLPVVSLYKTFAEAGGLLAYGANLPALYRRAAQYIDRILKGVKPGELPIEQPTRFDLVVNLKAAGALGLTLPPSVLARADEVIE
jgi:putative ABC transport system substrate-binding protein